MKLCGLLNVPYNYHTVSLCLDRFTAVLAEGSQVRSCRPYFATFLRYRNFLQHTDKLEPFGQLGHPRYYDDFIGALINALQSSNDHEAKKKEGIKKIMQLLLEQYA